jgi:hypothetical protein
MSNIARLRAIAPPPERPKGAGTASDWRRLESDLNLRFPEEFKELIATYGHGRFTEFFGVATPFYRAPRDIGYKEFVRLRIEGIRFAQSSYPEEAVPLPGYPENGGLFPWGYTDNGGTMCWLTEGESARWPIICLDDGNTKDFDRFDVSVVEFIEKWLTDQILVPTLTPPDFYPLRRPVFSQA